MSEYPLSMVIIEVVEAVAIVALLVMVVKLWHEVMIPASAEE
jgi:hypothetical protein